MRCTTRAVWVAWAVPAGLVTVTYSRVPPERLYHVTRHGPAGGLSRALVFVDFPGALVALALLVVTAGSFRGARARRVAVVAALLCASVAVPGVIDQDHLDARPISVVPAIGVLLALALTWRRPLPLRPTGRDAAVAAALAVLSLPWIAAQAGLSLPGRVFLTRTLVREPGEVGLVPAVHLGDHHGLSAAMLVVTALVLWPLARNAGAGRGSGRGARGYLALLLAYGLVNMVQDAWGEQVVARGWTGRAIPDALEPAASAVWLVIVLLALAAYRLLPPGRGRCA